MAKYRRFLPWLALFTIYVVWGSTYLAIAIAVQELPPFFAAFCRFLVAGVVLGAIALAFDPKDRRPGRRDWLDYGLIGVLFLGFGNGFVMWSEQRVPSGIAALVVATVPLWTTLLDGLRPGGTPWTLRGWFGTTLGLVGVVLVARPGGGVAAGHLLGIAALQFASIAWTIGALFSQSIKKPLPVFTASAIEMVVGSLALLVESRLAGEDLALVSAASAQAWGAMLYLVVFGSLIGFTAFAYCLSVLPAGTVSTYAYVNPVVAVALGALVLHEPLSLGLLGGALLILFAVVLTTRRPRPRPAPLEEAGRLPDATLKREDAA
jgi:drug/metabolite transporter (DMT)-like permease